MKPTAARAAIYCRISRDPEGIRAGVERQQEDCRAQAKREKLTVVAEYVDNDISASTLSKKTRPQFDAMVEGVRAGEFGAIIAYSNSRLTRRPLELEALIRLHEETGVRIVTVVSGEDNLATADGRMMARLKGNIDAAEAERLAERARRAALQRAQRGTTHRGGRSFGWNADKLTPHPVEAPLIRKAAAQVIDGVPLRVIVREWTDAGVRTARGGTWNHTTLRRALQRPSMVGWQTYRDEVLKDATGEPLRGEWEPILDVDTFERLQLTLAGNMRGGQRKGARRYLLTGIVRCSVCGARMTGMKTPKAYAYTCQPEPMTHSVTVQGPRTEELVLRVARERLARVDYSAATPPPPVDPSEGRLEQIPGLIAELMAAFTSGQLSGTVAFPQIEALEQERADLKAEHARFIASTAKPKRVAAEDLDALDVDRQRAILETLFDAIVVAPAKRRGEPWTPDRLTFVWKQD